MNDRDDNNFSLAFIYLVNDYVWVFDQLTRSFNKTGPSHLCKFVSFEKIYFVANFSAIRIAADGLSLEIHSAIASRSASAASRIVTLTSQPLIELGERMCPRIPFCQAAPDFGGLLVGQSQFTVILSLHFREYPRCVLLALLRPRQHTIEHFFNLFFRHDFILHQIGRAVGAGAKLLTPCGQRPCV
jgi:hypothetical protein